MTRRYGKDLVGHDTCSNRTIDSEMFTLFFFVSIVIFNIKDELSDLA